MLKQKTEDLIRIFPAASQRVSVKCSQEEGITFRHLDRAFEFSDCLIWHMFLFVSPPQNRVLPWIVRFRRKELLGQPN